MKKEEWKKKLSYHFDNYISKGFVAQCILLLVAIFLIVVLFGFLSLLTPSHLTIRQGLWNSMTHILDQGTISGDDTSDPLFIVIMIIVTFLGMAFTGTIVGIINNAMGDKLEDLKKGRSQIIEKGHTLIIGFDDDIHTLLCEITASNENWEENRTIVVIDDMEPEVMAQIAKEKNQYENKDKNAKKSPIVFRSGSIISENTFMIASAEKARSIIINKDSDFDVIRVMLALVTYLKRKDCYMNEKMPTIVSLVHEKDNVDATYIAAGVHHESEEEEINPSEYKIRSLYFGDILAHIFSQVCRQPGLSFVLAEIFNYDNDEIYIEGNLKGGKSLADAGFVGKSFLEISELASNYTPIGLKRGDEIILNPDLKTTVFEEGDELIHISEDDNEMMELRTEKRKAIGEITKKELQKRTKPYHFIFFGWSAPLNIILDNITMYCPQGSSVTIVSLHDEEEGEFISTSCKNGAQKRVMAEDIAGVKVTKILIDPYKWKDVREYLEMEIDWSDDNLERPTNMVILCRDGIDKVDADQKAAVLLLKIREYINKKHLSIPINLTAEMNLPEDQYLLQHTTSNDFIVGSEMANRMMVQVANSPHMLLVFQELLSNYGSELYLRRISDYVDTTKPYNFEKICDVARQRALEDSEKRELVMGWIYLGTDDTDSVVTINPKEKERTMILNELMDANRELYRIIVIGMEDYAE